MLLNLSVPLSQPIIVYMNDGLEKFGGFILKTSGETLDLFPFDSIDDALGNIRKNELAEKDIFFVYIYDREGILLPIKGGSGEDLLDFIMS